MRSPFCCLLVTSLTLAGCRREAPQAEQPAPGQEPAAVVRRPASVELRAPRVPEDLAWLAFGGGSDPLSNQISLAQDLALAGSMLAGRGLTLFASGKGAQVALARGDEPAHETARDQVRAELARLLGPQGAQSVRYAPAPLNIDAPSTREHVLDVLRGALASQGEPLLVIAASHGERGERPADSALSLWGGWTLTVDDVARTMDELDHPRPTRFLIGACYGGGFAELLFTGADARSEVRQQDSCGLFAAPWDDESSGCDPNPNRVQQESFTIHFLAALAGQSRRGEDARRAIDLDESGEITLLEAHAYARIHARSLDMPSTTSDRFLREFAPQHGGTGDDEREESSVIAALAAELELEDETASRAKLRELERILADAGEQLEQAQQRTDDAFFALRIALLERWPLLDHGWDPRAEALIDREATEMLALLQDSELAQAHTVAAHDLQEALVQYDAVRVARARVQRLVQAQETVRLARALKKQGGPRYQQYLALRRCERYAPRLR